MDLAASFARVQQRIENACSRAHRDIQSVHLLAVSKGHPPSSVDALARLGQTLFGESRVQEAKVKVPQCSSRLRWHLVGHLQTNKCRDAAQLFEMVHSVDTLKLAHELAKTGERAGRTIQALLEVNIAGESTKFGFAPALLLRELKTIATLPRLEIAGLMTIAPWSQEADKSRPVFERLRLLKQECEQALGASLPHLSMGMSHDLETAIEEGATIVRVGSDLFGPRPRPQANDQD